MKLITWNVNGIKSCINTLEANQSDCSNLLCDMLFLQEVRSSDESFLQQLKEVLDMSYAVMHRSTKSGYAGVAILSKTEPELIFKYDDILPEEGRILIAVYHNLVAINVYVPYIGIDGVNTNRRVRWEEGIINLLLSLKTNYNKPLIVAGDFNVAPTLSDRYKVSSRQPGCSDLEVQLYNNLLTSIELVDSYTTAAVRSDNHFTWGIKQGKLRIDHVLTSPELTVNEWYVITDLHTTPDTTLHPEADSDKRPNAKAPSDHYPLCVIIDNL